MKRPVLIAGPCVIESAELLDNVAAKLVEINQKLGTDIIFKASFDKANRTSITSFRGPGIDRGLQMMADIKAKYGLRLTTDIHETWQAELAGQVVDIIQIPAFLCRQTDLLLAAARTGKTVNIKKAQFLSGRDMRYPVEKARDAGAKEVWLTERGNMMGYNNLVVDFRNISDMLEITETVIMDCTHSVQRPGGSDGKTGGDRRFVPQMALAAKAFGATGFFFEAHPLFDLRYLHQGLADCVGHIDTGQWLDGFLQGKRHCPVGLVQQIMGEKAVGRGVRLPIGKHLDTKGILVEGDQIIAWQHRLLHIPFHRILGMLVEAVCQIARDQEDRDGH